MFKGVYYTAKFQVILVSLVCFCVPGMFSALNSLGGGGQIDTSTGSKSNAALNTTFTIFGLLGGGIVNLFGVRFTLFLSGLAYALYSGSYIYYNHTAQPGFTIAAGAILGIGAGVLWAGQGMIMTSYPLEKEKGKFIFISWGIFNMGGVLGSIIPVVVNSENNLSDAGYVAFLVIEVLGAILSLALAPPNKVTRSDGSGVIISKQENVLGELVAVLKLFLNPSMISLFFLSFSSNFFYSYEFNIYNAPNFTPRSKGFNNIFYWASQIVGCYFLSKILDSKLSRKKRAYIGTTICAVMYNSIWIGVIFMQRTFRPVREGREPRYNFQTTGAKYFPPILLYSLMGFLDSCWQSMAYWLIGSLSNDSIVLSRYVGFYKGVQSAGAAVSWAVDAGKMKPNSQLILNMVVVNAAIPFMYLFCKRIKETSEVNDPKTSEELVN
ncbi:hypothetical protein BB560_002509 [Smittium megazygosporum]|uniref:Major facilitator superfamily (MFS) profile domain-containing protein n=1 Tax=Smittium megazygosporum TaxID=133381 RepID=A0A2T9ZEL6_9FUNG|nr:hypothetical protein BB560_002509 [Smittium megazygosporum]